MKRKISIRRTIIFLGGIAGLFCLAAPLFAQVRPAAPPALSVPVPAKAAPVALTVTPEAGLERAAPGSVRFDFGAADPITTPRLEHVFTLRNDAKQPIALTRIKTSCGCETVLLLRGGKEQTRPEHKPAILAPGEQAQIRLSVGIAGRQGDTKRAFLWIYGPDPAAPLASIEITARLQPGLIFDPPALRFEKTATGLAQTQTLAIVYEPKFAANEGAIKVTSSSPYVEVSAIAGEKRELRGGKSVLVRSYRVTLAPQTPAGHLTGALTFELPGTASPAAPAAGPQDKVPAKITVSAPFSADRTGTLSAMPAALLFGSVSAGTEVKRQILLSVAALKTLQNLKVTSDSPRVTVRADKPEATGNGAALRIEVFLSGQTPAGAFSSRITITTESGEKLSVPLIAQVERK